MMCLLRSTRPTYPARVDPCREAPTARATRWPSSGRRTPAPGRSAETDQVDDRCRRARRSRTEVDDPERDRHAAVAHDDATCAGARAVHHREGQTLGGTGLVTGDGEP